MIFFVEMKDVMFVKTNAYECAVENKIDLKGEYQ